MCGITGWAAFGRDLRTAVPAVRRPWWRTRGPPAGPVRAPGVRRRARAGLGRAQAGHRTRPAPRRPGSAYQGPDSEVHASAEHVGVVLVVGVQVRQRTAAGGFVLNGGGAPRPGGEARRFVSAGLEPAPGLRGVHHWFARTTPSGSLAGPAPSGSAQHDAVCQGMLPPAPASPGPGFPRLQSGRCDGPDGLRHLTSTRQAPLQDACNEHQVGKSEGHAERSCWGGAGGDDEGWLAERCWSVLVTPFSALTGQQVGRKDAGMPGGRW